MKSARFNRILVLALLMLAVPIASFAGVFISITVAPPPLPVYVQPVCPQPGYMWAPGYWAWGDEGYFWVPGTWVPAPAVGMLWTPGYWGWSDGNYRWNTGYWGPHVGFYGGVNYGFGYGGAGFGGGEWRHGGFFYNSAVVNVNRTQVTNVYVNNTVIVNNNVHVSYNGGNGGIQRAPSPMEQQFAHENHIQATHEQAQHETAAGQNRQLLVKNNGGRPAIAATGRPGDFSARSVVPAKAAGGRVEPVSLNASARNMPSASASRPGAPAATRNNVPRPPSASNSNRGPAGNRGPAASASRSPVTANTSRPNTGSNQPQTRSNPTATRSNPAPNNARSNAPAPQRTQATAHPSPHQEQGKSNEHEKEKR